MTLSPPLPIGNPVLVEDRFSQLKLTEWKILVLLTNDFPNEDIMIALNLKRHTIKNLRYSIGKKLDLKGANTLARFSRSNRDFILSRYNLYRAQSQL